MQTVSNFKVSDKIRAAIGRGWKKSSIAELIGISRVTLDARLKDNSWLNEELSKIQASGILQ